MWASWPCLLLGVLAHLLRLVACGPSLGYSLSAFAWKTSPRVSCLISDVSLLREALRSLSFLCPALFSSVIGPPDISVLVCSRGLPTRRWLVGWDLAVSLWYPPCQQSDWPVGGALLWELWVDGVEVSLNISIRGPWPSWSSPSCGRSVGWGRGSAHLFCVKTDEVSLTSLCCTMLSHSVLSDSLRSHGL